MEKFKSKDISKYKRFCAVCLGKSADLDIHASPDLQNVYFPQIAFGNLIRTRRPEYAQYLPYKVKVKNLNVIDNDWTKGSRYLGLNMDDGSLELYLRPGKKYTEVELLWILLHEFRHKLQLNNSALKSCTFDNYNVAKFVQWAHTDANLVYHVFHEILAWDVDANIFACEILGIDYPGSKFDISNERLDKLKESQK